MSYSRNSFKGDYEGDCIGEHYRGDYGHTRSLDYSSHEIRGDTASVTALASLSKKAFRGLKR